MKRLQYCLFLSVIESNTHSSTFLGMSMFNSIYRLLSIHKIVKTKVSPLKSPKHSSFRNFMRVSEAVSIILFFSTPSSTVVISCRYAERDDLVANIYINTKSYLKFKKSSFRFSWKIFEICFIEFSLCHNLFLSPQKSKGVLHHFDETFMYLE